jgi:hypothetical protein
MQLIRFHVYCLISDDVLYWNVWLDDTSNLASELFFEAIDVRYLIWNYQNAKQKILVLDRSIVDGFHLSIEIRMVNDADVPMVLLMFVDLLDTHECRRVAFEFLK